MDSNSPVAKATSRAFISFWLYLFLVIWIAMLGTESRHEQTHWVAAFLTLGAAFTVSMFFKHVRLVQQRATSSTPLWETGKAMAIGIWVMAGIAVLCLWATTPGVRL